jgi:hypothetical protein
MRARWVGLLLLAPVGAALVTGGARPSAGAPACTLNWTGAATPFGSTGDFTVPDNWDLGRSPTPSDVACIPESYTGSVTLFGAASLPPYQVGGVEALNAGGFIMATRDLEITSADSTIRNLSLTRSTLQVDGSVTLTLTGASTWSGGSLSGGIFTPQSAAAALTAAPVSRIVVGAGSTLSVPGGTSAAPRQQPGVLLVNQGTVNWTGGDVCLAGAGIANDGTFNLRADGRSLYDCSASSVTGAGSGTGALTNDAGGMLVHASTSPAAVTLFPPGGVVNNGRLQVGPGSLTIQGPFQSGASASFEPTIAGTAAGTEFGQVHVTGALALGGAVNPMTAPSFTPQGGQSFAVIQCEVCGSTTFASSSGPYGVQYHQTDVSLVVGFGSATVAPASLDFGPVNLGSVDGPRNVTLTNRGASALRVGAVVVAGRDQDSFALGANGCAQPGGLPFTLVPGSTCTVQVSFRPTGPGTRTGLLSFADDIAGSPQSASLTGNGIGSASEVPGLSAPLSKSPAPKASSTPRLAAPSPARSPTSTAAPTSTVKPAAPGASLRVLSLRGQPFAPAGAGLNASIAGLPGGCATVYFFFDETRIGSAPVDASGTARAGEISGPGDARAGTHTLTASCNPSGKPSRESVPFDVRAGIHRSAFVTSLVEPRQLVLSPTSVLKDAGVAAVLLILLAFPAQLFNETLREHYEEIRGWFGLKRPLSEVVRRVDQRLLVPIFLLSGGVLLALITPEFGFNMSTLALVIGLSLAVGIITLAFSVPNYAYFALHYRERGRVLVLPGTVIVAALCVAVSRLLHFQPGYLYGLLAVFLFQHEPDRKTTGRLAGAAAVFVIGLALAFWAIRVPLSGQTMRTPGFLGLVVESALSGAFVLGLESVLVGLLPLRFLDGERIRAWSRIAWALLFAFGLLVLVEVLFQPGSGYVGHTTTAGKFAVAALYLVFGGASVGFWAYFRFRPAGRRAREEEVLR